MNPRVIEVEPLENYLLKLRFTNNEQKIFDVKPYLNKGFFNELTDEKKFRSVKAFLGSIQWDGGQDLCPDTLYLESKLLN